MSASRVLPLLGLLLAFPAVARQPAPAEALPKFAELRIGSTRWRVPDSYDFAISPDSKILAVPAAPREVRFWDASTGATVGVLTGPVPGGSVAVGPGAKSVVIREDIDRLRMWDATTSKAGKEFARKDQIIGQVQIAPDGKWLAAVSGDSGKINEVTVWGAGSGRAFFSAAADARNVTGLAISHDSGTLATVGSEGAVVLWDPATGMQSARLLAPKETGFRSGLAFTPDDKALVSVTSVHVVVWDLATKKPRDTFDLPTVPAALSPDGKWIAVPKQGEVQLWSVADKKLARTVGGGIIGYGQVRFAPDGSYLAMLTTTGQMRVWETATGKERSAAAGHSGAIQSLAFRPDGKALLSSSGDGTVRLWGLDGKEIRRYGPEPGYQSEAALSPDGKVVAVGGSLNTLLFDADTGKQLAASKDGGASLAFSPDGKTLLGLAGRRETTIHEWALPGLMERGQIAPPAGRQTLLLYSPDGKHVAVGGPNEPKTALLDPANGKLLRSVAGRPYAFSPDGKLLATGDRDEGLVLWDAAKGSKVKAIAFKEALPVSGAWSPDGKRIALGSEDRVVVWDTQTGKEVVRLVGHTGTVAALAWSPDGKWLASGGKDSTIVVWDVDRVGK